jgi:hypothetical protein
MDADPEFPVTLQPLPFLRGKVDRAGGKGGGETTTEHHDEQKDAATQKGITEMTGNYGRRGRLH